MDFLKGQLDKIQQQLGGLSASQKMLTGSLIAIMVMTLLWWSRYAGRAEMEPVLPQALSPSEIASVRGKLVASGINARVEGSQVLVPADRRDEAIAVLAYADLLPQDTISAFDEISQKMSPWDPSSKTQAYFKEAKQRTLQNVVRRFPGVRSAIVMIEAPETRRLNAANHASASVHIEMKDGGKGDRKLAKSAATLVVGAQQGLDLKHTRVVIGNRHYPFTGDADAHADSEEIGEAIAAHERRYAEKLERFFHFIPGVQIGVTVMVSNTATQVESRSFPSVMQKERQLDTTSESEPVPGESAAEPGASANTGATIDAAPRASSPGEKTREENKTQFENFADTRVESSVTSAGKCDVVGASIRVPRSYFVRMLKNASGSSAEPQQAALEPLIANESDRIRKDVIGNTDIKDEAKVMVSMYDDTDLPQLTSPATAAPTGSVMTTLSQYGKEIAVGVLAVVSLFMVSTMVRKAAPAPAVAAAAAAPRETPNLDAGIDLAGIVGDSDPMLDGMELDEDAVRTQQMLEQVQTLVGENPDAAANLVKRWLNRT